MEGTRNMNISKKALALMLVAVMLLSMTACSNDENKDPLLSESKQTLVDMINSQNNELIGLYENKTMLEDRLKEIQEEKGPTPGIEVIDDLTGKKTFTTVNDTIAFPTELKYPGSTQAPNTTSLNISEAVRIRPTANWICQMDGTTLELNHSSGISGKITIGTLDREAQKTLASSLEEYMSAWFTELPAGTIKYSRLYLKDDWFGLDATSNTNIDAEAANLRCGLLGFGDVSMQYMFVYKGDKDVAKDEVILSLIKTMEIWNVPLSVE